MQIDEKRYGALVEIPGVPYAFRWEGLCWVLYRWVEVETKVDRKKTGEVRSEWGDPVYPVDFSHMAQIIARSCGEGQKTVQETLAATVAERGRLEGVLTSIVAVAASQAGIRTDARGLMPRKEE